jgi:hypothetical protein
MINIGKRAEAKKAEADFLALLRENATLVKDGPWKNASDSFI